MPVKLIIAGSRTVYPTVEQIDAEILKLPIWGDIEPAIIHVAEVIAEVVSGHSPGGGADLAGEAWANARGIPIHLVPITDDDWKQWGKYLAPKIRNKRLAEAGDFLLAFWSGSSNGTTDMVTRMVLREKPVRVVPSRPTRKLKR